MEPVLCRAASGLAKAMPQDRPPAAYKPEILQHPMAASGPERTCGVAGMLLILWICRARGTRLRPICPDRHAGVSHSVMLL
jgi:hypothetical protein